MEEGGGGEFTAINLHAPVLALSLQLSHSLIRLERYLLSKLVHLTLRWTTPVIHRACCEAEGFISGKSKVTLLTGS